MSILLLRCETLRFPLDDGMSFHATMILWGRHGGIGPTDGPLGAFAQAA